MLDSEVCRNETCSNHYMFIHKRHSVSNTHGTVTINLDNKRNIYQKYNKAVTIYRSYSFKQLCPVRCRFMSCCRIQESLSYYLLS